MSSNIHDAEKTKNNRSGILGWMFFDWAAQPFFTVVLTFIFGPYFASRLAIDSVVGQAQWGLTITISGFIIAIFSPILGSIADASGSRKNWIGFFALVQITSLFLLWFAVPGSDLFLPMLCIILATIAAEFSIVFNDSMMPRLVSQKELGSLSNIAWGLGYAGGFIALLIVLLFFAGSPATGKTLLGVMPWFGLDPAQGEDARVTGPFAAVWYLFFLIPLFLFTPDIKSKLPLKSAIASGLTELAGTLKELKKRRPLLRFLMARMLYQDAINGLLALGGVFAAGMFHWQTMEVGLYGIFLLVAAIFGCIVASFMDSRWGSKQVVIFSLICLIVATLGVVSTGPGFTLFGLVQFSLDDSGKIFGTAAEKIYLLFGLLIGLVFGPAQASSRSYLARSVDAEEAGRYFGIYALSGRATAFLATAAVTAVTIATHSERLGMFMLVFFLLVGFVLLLSTPYPAKDKMVNS